MERICRLNEELQQHNCLHFAVDAATSQLDAQELKLSLEEAEEQNKDLRRELRRIRLTSEMVQQQDTVT